MTTTILIVEEHAPLHDSLREWLAMSFSQGCKIEATGGLEAVQLARDSLPQVVIVDVDMPEMDGLEVARRIKAAVPGSQMVILALDESQAHRAEAAEAGAGVYVSKGTLPSGLISAVESLLAHGMASRN